jgi:5,10-methylenetetrahydrofolate reductase
MSSSDIQLEMNFSERQNRFRTTVESGTFSLLVESGVPDPKLPVKEVLKQLCTLEETCVQIDNIPCGMALLDGQNNPGNWSAVEFAAQMSDAHRDRHVVYLSGANRDAAEIDRQLAIAANANAANIVAVSGDLGQNIPQRTDSGKIFKQLMAQSFFTGVTVNPYQYDPWALMAQYSKLAARIISDAGFFVTQMGWDTLKLQSLSWYLLLRNLYAPGFARLLFLTPERMKQMLEKETPGIIIGRELRKTMENELSLSRKLFDVAQLCRLKRQAAACRVLGFSGIQLCGADQPAVAKECAGVIWEGISSISSFEDFLECYHSEMAESEVNSFHLKFQLFDRVLKRPYPFDNPPQPAELPDPEVKLSEKIALIFSGKDEFSHRRQNVCTAGKCPKHNTLGPCGGVRHDGRCENGTQECVYRKWFRFAAANDAMTGIEKEMI